MELWRICLQVRVFQSCILTGGDGGEDGGGDALVLYQPHISVIYEEVPDTGCMSLIWPDMA